MSSHPWCHRRTALEAATPASTLKDARATSGGSRRRARRALVVAQLAVTAVVLTTAGLLARTLLELQAVDPFARFRCVGRGFDGLVPFSCKSRALCPSCGGRRMTERAAHLVDHVFPRVPVRQWVLSLPYRLRYRLAWDHALCRGVVRCAMRAILGFLTESSRKTVTGCTSIPACRLTRPTWMRSSPRSEPIYGLSWHDTAPPSGRTRLSRSIRERSRPRCGPGWPRRPCRGGWRWGRGPAPARAARVSP